MSVHRKDYGLLDDYGGLTWPDGRSKNEIEIVLCGLEARIKALERGLSSALLEDDGWEIRPHVPAVDDALMTGLLYAKTGLPWQVRMSSDAHNMRFVCKELSTGVKLTTPTLEPERWTIEELKKQADSIVRLYGRGDSEHKRR